jgi:hypothetical protein
MVMRRDRPEDLPPPLTEAETLLLLLGPDKADPRRGNKFEQLQFQARLLREALHGDAPLTWKRHEAFLLQEAKRLGIERPAGGFWGEGFYRRQHGQDRPDQAE